MFVGDDRRQVVGRLLVLFDQIRVEKRARLVVLRGQPGWGKTRVVQELYSILASKQKQPAYWPEYIAAETDDWDEKALRSSRKAVHPTAFMPEADVPEYLWIGIAADEGIGPRADSGLDEAIDQIAVQLAPRFTAKERTTALQKGLVGALGLVALGPAGAVLAPLLAARDVADIVDSLRKAFRTLRGSKIPITPEARLDEKLAAFRSTIGLIWASVLTDGPPGVLVIEDAHAIRRPSTLLIEEMLTQPGLPFLIIACAHPPQSHRTALDEIEARDLERVDVIDLDALNAEDVTQLILHEFPETNLATAAALAHHSSGNPYVTRLLLMAIRHTVRGKEITAEIGHIRSLPSGIDDLLLRLWNQLPEETQRTLSALAVIGNRSHADVDQGAISAVRSSGSGRHLWAEIEVSAQSGWLKDVGAWREFLEVARWQVAHQQGRLTREEQCTTLRAGQEALAMLFEQHPGDPFLAEIDSGILDAAVRLNVVTDPLTAARRLLGRSESLHVDNRHAEAEETARLAEAIARTAFVEDARRARALTAEALVAASRARRSAKSRLNDQALAWAEKAVEHARHLPAEDIGVLIRALASCSRSCRRLDDEEMMHRSEQMILEARRLFDSKVSVDSEIECDLLRAEYPWPSIRGDRNTAARLARHAFDVHAQIYGPTHRYSESCLADEGYYLLRVEPAKALTPREELLNQSRVVWGPDHNRTATREKDLAMTIIRAGLTDRAQEAHRLAKHAHDIHVQALGKNAHFALQSATVLARAKLFLADAGKGQAVEVSGVDALRQEALALATHALKTKRSRKLGLTQDCWPQRELIGLARAALGDPWGPEQVRETVIEHREWLRRRHLKADSRIELIWAVGNLCKALEYAGRADEVPEVRRTMLGPIDQV